MNQYYCPASSMDQETIQFMMKMMCYGGCFFKISELAYFLLEPWLIFCNEWIFTLVCDGCHFFLSKINLKLRKMDRPPWFIYLRSSDTFPSGFFFFFSSFNKPKLYCGMHRKISRILRRWMESLLWGRGTVFSFFHRAALKRRTNQPEIHDQSLWEPPIRSRFSGLCVLRSSDPSFIGGTLPLSIFSSFVLVSILFSFNSWYRG